MSFLRSLADSGQAILCTIHQPSAELFQVFDRLLLLRKGGQTVYFGDIGNNAADLIHYFESNGSRSCGPDENPAEFMLDVIGAGATAASDTNWHNVWKRSGQAEKLQQEADKIRHDGFNSPPIATTRFNEFAAPWGFQAVELIQRYAQRHWRDPTYLLAKLMLNIGGGCVLVCSMMLERIFDIVSSLLIGFTFFQSKNSLQGTQNKLFVSFFMMSLALPS
jgi:ATP-binding cassette subfamily G (WHITE) protein 2 (SNQ2)